MEDRRHIGPSIFIIGTAKTGTTFLFYSIKHHAERYFGSYRTIFEPRTAEDIVSDVDELNNKVLVKMLMERFVRCNDVSFLSLFHKKIVIVRDPRDTVISRMLYQMRDFFSADKSHEVGEICDLLRRKERSPESIAVVDIYNRINDIFGINLSWKIAAEAAKSTIDTKDFDDFFIVRYEDMVDGAWDTVADYLGFSVGPVEVAAKHQRVKRAARYGDWKNWFTARDVDLFRPILDKAMENAGYNDDWDLPADPFIDPSSSSEYVYRLFMMKNGNL